MLIARYVPIHPAMPRDSIRHTELSAMPATAQPPRMMTQRIKKIYRNLLSAHERFWNFSENIGISHTISQQNSTSNANKNGALNIGEVR